MSNQDADFKARAKRLKMQPGRPSKVPDRASAADSDSDGWAISGAILRPQLAFLLGAVALIVGRSIAMNQFMIEPSTELLGWGEGAVVVAILVVIGLLFGKSDLFSHGALIVGASLAFLGEGFYIPLIPDLMEVIYNPHYVSLVFLNSQ